MSLSLDLKGVQELKAALAALGAKAPAVMFEAVEPEGKDLMDTAVGMVPVLSGELQRSAKMLVRRRRTVRGSSARVIVRFGSKAVPYAAAVHWNPRSGRTGTGAPSGQSHFLQQPLKAIRNGYMERVAGRLKSGLGL